MSVRFEQVSLLPWNINSDYENGTKVVYNGDKYISKKFVPKGINIGFSEYWKKLELKEDVEILAEKVEDIDDDVDDLNVTVYGDETHTGLVDYVYGRPYTTTKQKVGTWLDGRDVYEIAIPFELTGTVVDNNRYYKMTTQIDNADFVVSNKGFWNSNAGNKNITFGTTEMSWTGTIVFSSWSYVKTDTHEIELYCVIDKRQYNDETITGVAIIEYVEVEEE